MRQGRRARTSPAMERRKGGWEGCWRRGEPRPPSAAAADFSCGPQPAPEGEFRTCEVPARAPDRALPDSTSPCGLDMSFRFPNRQLDGTMPRLSPGSILILSSSAPRNIAPDHRSGKGNPGAGPRATSAGARVSHGSDAVLRGWGGTGAIGRKLHLAPFRGLSVGGVCWTRRCRISPPWAPQRAWLGSGRVIPLGLDQLHMLGSAVFTGSIPRES